MEDLKYTTKFVLVLRHIIRSLGSHLGAVSIMLSKIIGSVIWELLCSLYFLSHASEKAVKAVRSWPTVTLPYIEAGSVMNSGWDCRC